MPDAMKQAAPAGRLAGLGRLWRGELPLDEAFWTWATLGGLIVNVASVALMVALLMAERRLAALIVGHIVSIPYNFAAVVVVWRAAGRYRGPRIWAVLARVAAVLGLGALSIL